MCFDVFLTKCRLSEHLNKPKDLPDIYYEWDETALVNYCSKSLKKPEVKKNIFF